MPSPLVRVAVEKACAGSPRIGLCASWWCWWPSWQPWSCPAGHRMPTALQGSGPGPGTTPPAPRPCGALRLRLRLLVTCPTTRPACAASMPKGACSAPAHPVLQRGRLARLASPPQGHAGPAGRSGAGGLRKDGESLISVHTAWLYPYGTTLAFSGRSRERARAAARRVLLRRTSGSAAMARTFTPALSVGFHRGSRPFKFDSARPVGPWPAGGPTLSAPRRPRSGGGTRSPVGRWGTLTEQVHCSQPDSDAGGPVWPCTGWSSRARAETGTRMLPDLQPFRSRLRVHTRRLSHVARLSRPCLAFPMQPCIRCNFPACHLASIASLLDFAQMLNHFFRPVSVVAC
jgi:hypothetical protein